MKRNLPNAIGSSSFRSFRLMLMPVLFFLSLTHTGLGGEQTAHHVAFLSAPKYPIPSLKMVLVLELQESASSALFANNVEQLLSGSQHLSDSRAMPALYETSYGGLSVLRAKVPKSPTPDMVKKLAQDHQAQAILIGSFLSKEEPTQRWTEDATRIVKTDNGEKKEPFKKPCARNKVSLTFDYTLFDSSGNTIAKDSGIKKLDSSDCDEDGPGSADTIELASIDIMSTSMTDDIRTNCVLSFAPHYRAERFVSPTEDDYESLLSECQKQNWSGAVSKVDGLWKQDSLDPMAFYYAALVSLVNGNHNDASTFIAVATRYTSLPWAQSLDEIVKKRQSAVTELGQVYGLASREQSMPGLNSVLENARSVLSQKVSENPAFIVKKPVFKSHVAVRTTAEKKAPVSREVRHSLRVYALATEGKMTRVLLPDGTSEGWMQSNDLKAASADANVDTAEEVSKK